MQSMSYPDPGIEYCVVNGAFLAPGEWEYVDYSPYTTYWNHLVCAPVPPVVVVEHPPVMYAPAPSERLDVEVNTPVHVDVEVVVYPPPAVTSTTTTTTTTTTEPAPTTTEMVATAPPPTLPPREELPATGGSGFVLVFLAAVAALVAGVYLSYRSQRKYDVGDEA